MKNRLKNIKVMMLLVSCICHAFAFPLAETASARNARCKCCKPVNVFAHPNKCLCDPRGKQAHFVSCRGMIWERYIFQTCGQTAPNEFGQTRCTIGSAAVTTAWRCVPDLDEEFLGACLGAAVTCGVTCGTVVTGVGLAACIACLVALGLSACPTDDCGYVECVRDPTTAFPLRQPNVFQGYSRGTSRCQGQVSRGG